MNEKPKELEEHSAHIFEMGCMEQRVYLKNDADAVIEAKDAEIAKMNAKIEELESKNAQLEDDVAFWKKKLSSCLNGDCILTCDTVEKYGKENVRLKRALWLARAERAHLKVLEYWPDYCHNAHCRIAEQKWDKVERKCRAMAEKFK